MSYRYFIQKQNELKKVFVDTLSKSENVSMETKVYSDTPDTDNLIGDCLIKVVDSDSLTAAKPNYLVLNFASGWTPGGGVKKGMSAQEENLCQRSSLYKSLISPEASDFYSLNHLIPNMGSTCSILTKNVLVLKDKEFNDLKTPYYIDVLSVAAPRITESCTCTPEFLEDLLDFRINHILSVAAEHKYRNLILGAWGCGVYKNDPKQVARLFHKYINKYSGYFDEIIFAISKGRNYNTFVNEFKQ